MRLTFGVFFVLGLSLAAGCFASRISPPLASAPKVDALALRVAVRIPQLTEFADINEQVAATVVEDLTRTRLFQDVRLSAGDQSVDLVVEYVETKRPDPSDWCYDSLAYVGFTLFVVPGCWESFGYKLRIHEAGGPVHDLDFSFHERQVAGFAAIFLLPASEWETPDKNRVEARRAEYLADQLRPLLESMRRERRGEAGETADEVRQP